MHIKVGMLRQYKTPITSTLAAALSANYFDMDFLFFNPDNIDFKYKKIKGLTFVGGKWESCVSDFPDVIDNSPPRKQNLEIYNKLNEFVPFTTPRIGNKDSVYDRLVKDKTYEHLLIPTHVIRDSHQIFLLINEYKNVIIKPRGGNRGRNIVFIKKTCNGYTVIMNRIVKDMRHDEMKIFFEETKIGSNYILQPYIKSLTNDNLPFDVRIHVRRGLDSKWKIIKIYPRIGTSDGITSNISQGGYIGDIDKLLKRQFAEKSNSIKDNLNKVGKDFPVYFQTGYSYMIDALGIDLGIDENGKFWLFEVNSYPGSTSFELEAQIAAMGYAKYIALNNNLISKKKD